MSGQGIRRSSAAACIGEYERKGNVGAPPKPEQEPANPGAVFFGVNTSSGVIAPGDMIAVTGFYPTSISYEQTKRQILRNKIKLSVQSTYPASGSAGIGGATSGARHGGILRFVALDGALYFAHVHITDTSGIVPDSDIKWVDKNGEGLSTSENAVADILFKTPKVGEYCVAFCCQRIATEMTGEEIVDKLRVSSGNTVTSVTPSRGYVSSATGSASGSYTPVGNITLALVEATPQASGVEVVVDIQAVDGVLGVETKKLTATFTGDPATITSTVATQDVNVVTDVTSSSANRVSSVTAR